MKINPVSIKDAGNLDGERVVMKVVAATDVGAFMLADTTRLDDSSVSAKLKRIYWFKDALVAKGDYVVLYTKAGGSRQSENKAGTTTHYFFWGLPEPIWDRPKSTPVIVEIADWASMDAD